MIADRLGQFRFELDGEAFVAADMVVMRADKFVAGETHEERTCDKLEFFAARTDAEAPLADIGE